MKHDIVYLNLLKDILIHGIQKKNRTGTDTISVFGKMIEFDVSEFVPILTTKELHLKSIIHELLWFLRGDTNIKYLQDNGVSIWNEWANTKGEIGKMYGYQWRKWPTGRIKWTDSSNSEPETCDQIQELINEIKRNPNSRRLMVSAWNAPMVWDNQSMSLAPCHYGFLCNVEGEKLNLKFEMRSCDVGLGLPFNVASYTILLYMIASLTGYKPGKIIASLGDAHIYINHSDGLKEQLLREPLISPRLKVNPNIKNIDDFKFEDIEVIDYISHPKLKLPIAV